MKFHKYFLIVIIGITRCTPYPEGVMTALEHSGDNRQELEKAIFFFKTKEDNELKLRALYFLVEQIPYYSTLNYRFVNENNEEIPLSEWNYVNVVEAREQLAKNRLYFQKGDAISDLTTVTSDYLIKNVDLAFEVWQNYPWCSNLNFDQFCKYILPHKLNGDPLNNWREYYYNKHKNDLDSLKMIGATREQVCTWLIDRYAWDWIRSASIIPVEYLSYDKIKIIGGGSCDHLSRNQVQLMRACGIPMNMDIIPYHGRLNGGHSFTSFYDENNVLVSFYSSNEKGPDRSEWRAPKVLRYNFAIDYEKLNDYHARRNSSVFLSNPFLEDVTTQYFTSADISLNLENNKGEQIFLCTYNNGKFSAVYEGFFKNDHLIFKGVTKELLYFPMYYDGLEFIPATNPFILDEENNLLFFDTKDSSRIDLKGVKLFAGRNDITRPGSQIDLYLWRNKWEYLASETVTHEKVLNFEGVPEKGIFVTKGTKGSELVQRPFTLKSGEVQYW